MNWNPQLRLFFYVAGGLFVVNLLVMNEVTTIWDGAETRFVWAALYGPSFSGLPPFVARWFSGGELQEFLLRLPGVLVLQIGMWGFFYLFRPLIGRPSAWMTMLVMAASFLLPALAKVATLDSWSFAFHLLGTALLIRFVKQPKPHWRWLTYLILGLSVVIDPLKSLVYFTLLSILIGWRHPQGRAVWRLQPWLALLVVAVAGSWGSWLNWRWEGIPPGLYALAIVTGMLPFFGFWLAGCWDTLKKALLGEELAVLNSAWIVAALLSQSWAIAAVFALITAKQLLLYFEHNYPFRNIVKTGAILHLLGVFFLAMGLMLYGFIQFGGAGFRAGLAFGGSYWVLSLLGVLGLYGTGRRLIWGGVIGSGLVATLLFWLQINPLLESRRDLPKRLAAEVELRQRSRSLPVVLVQPGDSAAISNELLYLQSYHYQLTRFDTLAGLEYPSPYLLISRWEGPDSVKVGYDSTLVRGWNDRLQPEAWLVRKVQ